jgi:putrescine aminotransferase
VTPSSSGTALDEGYERIEPFTGLMAEVYDDMATETLDLQHYLQAAEVQGGAVLELGCGTGRVTLPLALVGHEVVGLDLSDDMLDILRRRMADIPADAAARVTLVRGDATDFELGRRFALIIFPFASVCILPSRQARLAMMRCVARHLADGGVFMFDTPDLTAAQISDWGEPIAQRDVRTNRGLASVHIAPRLTENGELKLYSRWMFPQAGGPGRELVETKTLALLSQADVEGLARDAGLAVVNSGETQVATEGGGFHMWVCRRQGDVEDPLWLPYAPEIPSEAQAITLVRGQGAKVWDQAGKAYIDACSGLWNAPCGLGRPEIIAAVSAQLEQLSYASLFQGRGHEPARRLARELVGLAPPQLDSVFLTCSGSEAIELAIKMARQYFALEGAGTRNHIAFLDQSYHGTFFGGASVSGLLEDTGAFGPLVPNMIALPTPDMRQRPPGQGEDDFARACAVALEQADAACPGGVAALVIEPVLGSAGVIIPPQAYFDAIGEICERRGILLIVDEVATGLGRSGHWFASEAFGLRPDFILLSKGLAAGYLPIGAVLFSRRLSRRLRDHGAVIGHGSTHDGNPAACAAAIAGLELMRREGAPARAAELGQALSGKLEALAEVGGAGAVRAMGLMFGVDLVQTDGRLCSPLQTAFVVTALERLGVLVYTGPASIVMMPPLVLTDNEADIIVACIDAVLSAVTLADDGVKPVRP